MFKLMDYHTHTAVTIDGRMTEAQACERAIERNVREIAFTNHVMLTQPDYCILPDVFVKHWEQIQICQRRYPQLTIRLGVELDYYDGLEDEIAATINRYETLIGRRFDLVLGSVHQMRGVFFASKNFAPDLFRDQDLVMLYRDYFALATQAVQSRLYDVMAHPDLIKKYTDELSPRVPFERYSDVAENLVDALLETRVGIEINTKGYKLPVGEAYPSPELLALYISKAKAKGIEPIVTLGSDAHKAADVGGCLAEGMQALKNAHHNTLMRFENRKPIAMRIE